MLALSALVLAKESTPALTVVVPLKLLLPERTTVPTPLLVRLPAPEIAPELVKILPPSFIVPLPVKAKLLVTSTLAKAATVVLLLAKVTVFEPNEALLLIATVPALIVVPPV